jgi:hypothetical protein
LAIAALQRFWIFLFFLINLKKEKEWEKERGFDTRSLMFRLRWLLETQASFNNTNSNVSSAFLLAGTTRVATTQEFQKHKKFVAFNMKQQGIEFF